MGELEKVHKKKLLSKVKEIMIEDIILTLGVIIERSEFTVTPRAYNVKTIGLDSFVDGYEGKYPLLEVDVKLVEYNSKLVPKLIIKSLISSRNDIEMLLPQVTSAGLIEAYDKSILNKNRNLKMYVLDETQSERIDLMEKVSVIVDSIKMDSYFLTGVSRYSKNLI